MDEAHDIIDWAHFEEPVELGPGFIRILSYFREDGAKSVSQIEQAMHSQNTVALVIPPTRSRARRGSSGRSRWRQSPS